ncbi:MAG: hypothetical protein UT05_C0015G0008 [Parcubacteria group bacterium GW2011_GWF2_38_76]|nr:MAG: hypothetical protein UT05_C0015G0008 [Parcubacteria group bacterium GW2011_GWF2_38_76]
MKIVLANTIISIDSDIYEMLFDNSWIHLERKYQKSLSTGEVRFADFVELARKADIPYSIFFSPRQMVINLIDLKYKKLLSGISLSKTLLMNSRGIVQIKDVELIVKDIMRKQELLKRKSSLGPNEICSCLRRSKASIIDQANYIKAILNFDNEEIKVKNKSQTYRYIIDLLESKNVFVSQSSNNYMPQRIRSEVRFSGFCVKDKLIPFIFLNNKEDHALYEQEGRRVLTLVLLTVCLAKGRYMPVKFNEQSKNIIRKREYEIVEEILMPSAEFKNIHVDSLADIKEIGERYSVTPSAVAMRLRRLAVINEYDLAEYLNDLASEFNSLRNNDKRRPRNPSIENGFAKYNSLGYSKAIMKAFDEGRIDGTEIIKTLFKKKGKVELLYNYRAKLKI